MRFSLAISQDSKPMAEWTYFKVREFAQWEDVTYNDIVCMTDQSVMYDKVMDKIGERYTPFLVIEECPSQRGSPEWEKSVRVESFKYCGREDKDELIKELAEGFFNLLRSSNERRNV